MIYWIIYWMKIFLVQKDNVIQGGIIEMGDILQKVEKNEAGRDYCIGDLHGCYDDFQQLLDDIHFDTDVDRMFSVGDLVDRGPKSLECLELIKEDWFYCIRGNHEDLMITAVLNMGNADAWHMNGGNWGFQEKYGPEMFNKVLKELVKLTAQLPLAIELETDFGRVGLCHAQAPKDWNTIDNDMSRNEKYKMIWDRTKIQNRDCWNVENIDFTIHGHTPTTVPVCLGNSLYIDTGICFKGMKMWDGTLADGMLTCVEISKVPEHAINMSWANVQKELAAKGKSLFD